MCRSKKINDTPLAKMHKLLTLVYTAEFRSGNETADDERRTKTVNRVYNAPIKNRGAIPSDVCSKTLDAFTPEKSKTLLDGEDWKCICCNEGASQYCSSVVGAQSKENVISLTEKIYVVCGTDECIAKVTQKRNNDARKLVGAGFDFRFSFRSALLPIRVGGEKNAKQESSSLVFEAPLIKETGMETETESCIVKENNPVSVFEMELERTASDEWTKKEIENASSMKAMKKRKLDVVEKNFPSQDLSEHTAHKRMKLTNLEESDESERFADTIVDQSSNNTKEHDEEVKENVATNARDNMESKRSPIKVHLKEFPFIFDGNGAWLCRHCLGVPCHIGSHHCYASRQPPPNEFIDHHLRLCPVMSRHFRRLA